VTTTKVLLVERSTAVRGVLRRVLSGAADVSFVGEAGDLEAAFAQVQSLEPDVLVLGGGLLFEPGVDNDRVRGLLQRPSVVITPPGASVRDAAAFRNLIGAPVEIIDRPEVPRDWEELAGRLPDIVRQLGAARWTGARPSVFELPQAHRLQPVRFLIIGASTGGPGAVRAILNELGSGTPLAVALVQHMSAGFEVGFVNWLDSEVNLDIALARDGEQLEPGRVRVGRCGAHLTISRDGMIGLDTVTPPVCGHQPAVDVLFRSLAAGPVADVAAVLLSGMGRDGAEGLLELRTAGAITIVQEETTCAVFGMPRAALELGAAGLALPPQEIGRLVAALARRDR
jgi:two-component system chemotaxis response regulator CheB